MWKNLLMATFLGCTGFAIRTQVFLSSVHLTDKLSSARQWEGTKFGLVRE